MFRVILNLRFCSKNNKKKKYTSIDRSTISTIGEKFGQLNWILDESDENLNLIFLEKKKGHETEDSHGGAIRGRIIDRVTLINDRLSREARLSRRRLLMRHEYDTTRTGIANQECILEEKRKKKSEQTWKKKKEKKEK